MCRYAMCQNCVTVMFQLYVCILSFPFPFLWVYVCMCMHVCMCVFDHMYVHAWEARGHFQVSFLRNHPFLVLPKNNFKLYAYVCVCLYVDFCT